MSTRAFFVAAAAVASAGVAAGDASVVVTPLGAVQGIVGAGWRVFEGVPYAAPPVGPLRWQPPQPVAPWAPATLNATSDPPGCMQLCVNNEPPHICPNPHISEDCLYMNIWTPNPPPAGPVPVLIFIHGGNFVDGAAGGLDAGGPILYDGRRLVSNHAAIVVVIQYRLGAWGFLNLGDGTTINGNYGLADQIAATTWVRDNIAPFGGDPSRITLVGQSAGAMSIGAHLTRPELAGLFSGAVMLSNPHGQPWRDMLSALDLANVFANFSGCNFADLRQADACLRALDADTLLAAQIATNVDILADVVDILQVVTTWSPTVGTAYLPERPLEAFQRGHVMDIPYVISTTANETVIFVYEALTAPLDATGYAIAASVLIGPDDYEKSQALYPVPSPPPADYRVFASYLLTDGLFLCPTRNATEALQVAQPFRRSPAFHLQYNHLLAAASNIWSSNFTECWTEVCHGSDLPAWFLPNDPAVANYTAAESALSDAMQGYLVSFAATGNPGTGVPGGVPWPAYTASTREVLVLETADKGGITVQSGIRAEFCAWWDDVVGYRVY
jgi:carboxylesterase type B